MSRRRTMDDGRRVSGRRRVAYRWAGLCKKPILGMVLAAAVLNGPAQAQETGLSFLRLGEGAAAAAMGDTQVAASRDAFSTYWNPAGLPAAPSNTAAVSHRIWIGDVRAYAASARFRAGANGGVGLAVTAVDSGDLEAREGPGDPDGLFDAQFVSVSAAYGRRVGPLRAGVTAKYLSERIFESSANGYAFDVGVQADVLGDKLFLGAALQHLGKMSRLDREASELPKTLRAGAAAKPLRILAETDGTALLDVTLAAEVSHVFSDEITQVHVGAAGDVLELVTLRVGLITNDDLRDVTFGAGLHAGAVTFDYAFLPFESGFDGPGHVLTLHYSW